MEPLGIAQDLWAKRDAVLAANPQIGPYTRARITGGMPALWEPPPPPKAAKVAPKPPPRETTVTVRMITRAVAKAWEIKERELRGDWRVVRNRPPRYAAYTLLKRIHKTDREAARIFGRGLGSPCNAWREQFAKFYAHDLIFRERFDRVAAKLGLAA